MMTKTYAIIESGVVANLVLSESPLADNWVFAQSDVAIGWLYDGEAFAAAAMPEPPPDPVPASCTRRQGLRALISYGFMPSQIESLIDAIPDEVERELARVDYEAATWERADESLQAVWAQLGGTPEQLDDLFRLAVTL